MSLPPSEASPGIVLDRIKSGASLIKSLRSGALTKKQTFADTQKHMQACAYTHTHTHAHTYTHAHTQTRTYGQTCVHKHTR